MDFAKFHEISLSEIGDSINKKHDELIGEFQKLHDEFLQQFSLNLITYRNKSNDIRDQFRFDSLYTTFQGRIREISTISDFLFDSRVFSFYMVTGPGGAGKSRLAQECCVRAEGGRWISGFCDQDKNRNYNWDSFRPNAPTLIVLDYIKGRKR